VTAGWHIERRILTNEYLEHGWLIGTPEGVRPQSPRPEQTLDLGVRRKTPVTRCVGWGVSRLVAAKPE
jgi:hypothetical protein